MPAVSNVKSVELKGGSVVGDVPLYGLDTVKPNPWNPNVMTDDQRASLKHGLQTDGWLSSQALLVWGKDDNGKKRMLIIDGEHRWEVAKELGFKEGPMVFLAGVSESKARSLTVAMNARRGTNDEEKLAALLKGIQFDIPDLDLNVGISGEALAKLLAEPEVVIPAGDVATGSNGSGEGGGGGTGEGGAEGSNGTGEAAANVRMVQLFFNEETHAEFQELVQGLAPMMKTKTVTDTVLEVLRDYDAGGRAQE